MTSRNKAYAKVFGLFLVMAACGGAVVSLINRNLRTHDMSSQMTTYILWLFLMVYFFFVCRWIFRKLNTMSNDK